MAWIRTSLLLAFWAVGAHAAVPAEESGAQIPADISWERDIGYEPMQADGSVAPTSLGCNSRCRSISYDDGVCAQARYCCCRKYWADGATGPKTKFSGQFRCDKAVIASEAVRRGCQCLHVQYSVRPDTNYVFVRSVFCEVMPAVSGVADLWRMALCGACHFMLLTAGICA
eukprot:CAMPEP_0204132498 /NCGR_PEP_ID=MMETSP0361-20130328/14555_1 /ASSEMBLY_ACC=CAM_ASM_000343 /TAXON_ID=268821 /ORGANISM="Scrippsiella Hangoei, Strain SHTV-5" /LENGTH=170 /DNA_ID=CAMNT_0051085409 /DNA_START=45 /DNA_END=558 /DNA_ORIENTATION=+